MNDNKKIPEFTSYEEMADFWGSHDLADFWDQTEPADFEVSPQARWRNLVSIDRNLLIPIQQMARARGVTIESLVNLLLEQRLHELKPQM